MIRNSIRPCKWITNFILTICQRRSRRRFIVKAGLSSDSQLGFDDDWGWESGSLLITIWKEKTRRIDQQDTFWNGMKSSSENKAAHIKRPNNNRKGRLSRSIKSYCLHGNLLASRCDFLVPFVGRLVRSRSHNAMIKLLSWNLRWNNRSNLIVE